MIRCSQEINEAVNEALSVRQELEDIMQEAVGISTTIVNGLEDKISVTNNPDFKAGNLSPEENIAGQAVAAVRADTFSPDPGLSPIKQKKTRVYELAQDLGITSKELLLILRDLDIKAKSHMNILDEKQVDLIKKHLDYPGSNVSGGLDEKLAVSRPLPLESISTGMVLDFLAGDAVSREDIFIDTCQMDNCDIRVTPDKDSQFIDNVADFSLTSIQAAHPYIAVNMLHEKGYSIREIAKLLDKGQGEVSLILKLAQKKQSAI
ncbi:Translation initiation factor IF-2, N-terminal [Syntrophomonas zehnderi OL-4]|uniref:Translation initiation factor IF-2, N-terminal n=1 Tax=Syntrophomonas zehnderi OL-4 TaxID=690567 RepID=A0A0E3W3A2_9FIRM|nr:translation initiation factor IF-2 N-terminal domain-containing protein [Syntrophomonas zehnderi]CFX66594.1 Translation initiation factor IF-2, N-terminal [Syntrophomonas zehnderi OL-4]